MHIERWLGPRLFPVLELDFRMASWIISPSKNKHSRGVGASVKVTVLVRTTAT